jgi:LuxR family maltose regulon positive regulatory protein
MRGRYWLALGDLAEVANWVERQEELLPPIDLYCQVTDLFLTVIQSYIALQRTTDALRLLAELLLQTEDLERRRDRIAFLALQVTALSATNEMAEAKRIATHLLTLTEAEGIIRIYLDAGLPMQQVLQSLLDTQPPHEDEEAERRQRQLRLLLRAFEQEAAHHSKPSLSPTTTSIHIAQVAFETLTPREHEVLRLLAQGATNLDIAEQLVISLATVKKHVANILNKLGVENRVQAVARARDYEML